MKLLKLNFNKININKLFVVLVVLCFQHISSQNGYVNEGNEHENIKTKFLQYGSLRKTNKNNALSIAQFNKGQKCFVIGYYGKDQYKIIYKKRTGYVTSKYLVVNNEMRDLVKKYQNEKERVLEATNSNEEDKKNSKLGAVNDIQVEKNEAKAKAEEEKRLADIAKAKTAEAARIKAEQESRIKQEAEAKARQEAAAKAKAEEEKRLANIAKAKAEEAARIKAEQESRIKKEAEVKARQEAAAKAKAEEEKRLADIAKAKAEEAARIKAEQESRIKQEAEAKARQEAAAKAKAEEEKRLANIAKAKLEDEAVKEKIRQKQIEQKNKIQNNKNKIADSISRVNDSIAKIRKSCSYQINEIDTYYNVKIVKTENYQVNNDLHIELFKNSNNRYIFINYSGDLGCASYFTHNRSSARIQLENNDIVTIYHSWDIDCANFSLKGILTDSALLKLEKSPIKSIKLKGTKGNIEIENLEYKEIFMDKLKCID